MAKKARKSRATTRRSYDFEEPMTAGADEYSTMSSGGGRGSESARNYKDILFELSKNPTVRYVAAGLATAILTRVANNISEKYPEVSSFLRENIDNFEGKLDEFKSGLNAQKH